MTQKTMGLTEQEVRDRLKLCTDKAVLDEVYAFGQTMLGDRGFSGPVATPRRTDGSDLGQLDQRLPPARDGSATLLHSTADEFPFVAGKRPRRLAS